jgi:serine/threonine protein kinase
MEIDLPKTKKYLNPSLLTQNIQSNVPPKRKFGGIVFQDNIPEEFQAEIVKRSTNKPIQVAPFRFNIDNPVNPGKQEKSPPKVKRQKGGLHLPVAPVTAVSPGKQEISPPKVKRQKGGLHLPVAPATPDDALMPAPKAKAKKTVRRTTAKKGVQPTPIIINFGQKMGIYAQGESVVLEPNDFRSKPLTFQIMNKLGEGAYGEVYQIFTTNEEEIPDYFPSSDEFPNYAMKVMIKDTGKRSFEYEHQIMNLIATNFKDQPGRCPKNVLCYFDISIDKNGKYHMLSEKMDGNISDYMKNMKSASRNSRIDLALKVFEQTLSGLEDLKKIGLLHRDLKEENLLYKIPAPKGKPRPSEMVIKIGDFGLSCVNGLKDLECGKGIAGTLIYIDPKILLLLAAGTYVNIDPFWTDKNDMYSLAVILYQIVFGIDYIHRNDRNKIAPNNRLDAKSLTKLYLDIYQRNVVNINELIKEYENSKVAKNVKIVKMLKFMKRNLVPFDFDQRTTLDESLAFFT